MYVHACTVGSTLCESFLELFGLVFESTSATRKLHYRLKLTTYSMLKLEALEHHFHYK